MSACRKRPDVLLPDAGQNASKLFSPARSHTSALYVPSKFFPIKAVGSQRPDLSCDMYDASQGSQQREDNHCRDVPRQGRPRRYGTITRSRMFPLSRVSQMLPLPFSCTWYVPSSFCRKTVIGLHLPRASMPS